MFHDCALVAERLRENVCNIKSYIQLTLPAVPFTGLLPSVLLLFPLHKLGAFLHNRCLGSQISCSSLRSLSKSSLRSYGVPDLAPSAGMEFVLRDPDRLSVLRGTTQKSQVKNWREKKILLSVKRIKKQIVSRAN